MVNWRVVRGAGRGSEILLVPRALLRQELPGIDGLIEQRI